MKTNIFIDISPPTPYLAKLLLANQIAGFLKI